MPGVRYRVRGIEGTRGDMVIKVQRERYLSSVMTGDRYRKTYM